MSNGLNKKFLQDPMAFALRTAINAGNNIEGYKGAQLRTMEIPNVDGKNLTYSVARVATAKKVAYMNMTKRPHVSQDVLRNDDGSGTVDVKGHFHRSNAREFPVYYLPWQEGGGTIRLTIPVKGTLPEDPDIFFTAAISGCSVHFQGAANNPSIYHSGGDSGQPDSHAAAAATWRTLVNAHRARGRGAISPNEVNKTDYVKTPGAGTAKGNTTPNALAYEQWLVAKNKTKLTVQYVLPWGCVFGLRTGVNWAFYLQENAHIVYNTLTKATPFSQATALTWGIARVMTVREVFPNPVAGPAVVFADMPKVSSF